MKQAEAQARAAEEGPAQRSRRFPSWIPDRGPGLVVFVIAAIVLLISVVAVSVLVVEYRRSRADLRQVAEARAIEDVERASDAVALQLKALATAVDNVAAGLNAQIATLSDRGDSDPVGAAQGSRIPREPHSAPGLRADAPLCEEAVAGTSPGLWRGIEYELCAHAAQVPNINGLMAAYATLGPEGAYQPYAQITDGVLKLRYPNVEGFNRPTGAAPLDEYWNAEVGERRPYIVRALEQGGPVWSNPLFGRTSQTMIAYYSRPFHLNGEPVGVVMGTFTLDRLADDVSFVQVSGAGYPFIFRENDPRAAGVFINHPEPSRYRCAQGLDGGEPILGPDENLPPACASYDYTLIDHSTQELMQSLFLGGRRNDRGVVTGFSDPITGERAMIAYSPVAFPLSTDTTSPSPPWTFAAVVYEDEVLARTDRQTQLLIQFGLFALLGLLAVTVLIVRPRGVSNTRLWVVAGATSAFALLGIGWIWYLVATAPRALDPVETSGEVVHETSTYVDDDTSVVRTGVFIQGIHFRADEDVVVEGLTWQEFEPGTTDYRPGLLLPEARTSEFVEQYRQREGNTVRVGWRFTATLPQTFDARRFPFDQTSVWLRLWPSDLTVETMLVPDLPQYQILAPLTRPGLEVGYEVDGWNIQGSYFSHRRNTYNTNPGPLEWIDQEAGEYKPELYFTTSLKREFLDPFISSLVPLIVVWLMLFGVLLAASRRVQAGEHDPFPRIELPLIVLGFAAGLFFIVILSQIDLRRQLQADSLVYMEFFHLATYLAIFGVSANALLISSRRGGAIVHYRENLVPELLYWPLLLGGLLVVTLITFY